MAGKTDQSQRLPQFVGSGQGARIDGLERGADERHVAAPGVFLGERRHGAGVAKLQRRQFLQVGRLERNVVKPGGPGAGIFEVEPQAKAYLAGTLGGNTEGGVLAPIVILAGRDQRVVGTQPFSLLAEKDGGQSGGGVVEAFSLDPSSRSKYIHFGIDRDGGRGEGSIVIGADHADAKTAGSAVNHLGIEPEVGLLFVGVSFGVAGMGGFPGELPVERFVGVGAGRFETWIG